MAQRTGQAPGSGPRERVPARGRFAVAGGAPGMAAGQVPVPDRSVPLGRVTTSGPRPHAAGDGGRTSGTDTNAPSPVRTAAHGPRRATRRTAATVAEPVHGRSRRKVVPFVLAVLCVVLVGTGVHQVTRSPSAGSTSAAAPATPAAAADEEQGRGGGARESQGPTGPDAPAAAPGPGAAPTAPPATAPAPAPATREVVLKRGDTLWELARDHHTTVRALQELNGLGHSTLIYVGAVLRVPAAVAVPSAAQEADTTGATAPAGYVDGVDIRPSAGNAPGPASGPGVPSGSRAVPEPGTKENRDRGETGGEGEGDGTGAGRGAGAAVAFARAQLGKPYAWGASGPGSFDCSGLVVRAWQAGGAKLPRTTWDMARAGRATTRHALVPGDLVITNGGGHVQLYIGNGKVIHAPGRGRSVTVAPLTPASGVVAYRHVG